MDSPVALSTSNGYLTDLWHLFHLAKYETLNHEVAFNVN